MRRPRGFGIGRPEMVAAAVRCGAHGRRFTAPTRLIPTSTIRPRSSRPHILAPAWLAAPMLLSGSMLAQPVQAWRAWNRHIGVAQLKPCRRSALGVAHAVAKSPARADGVIPCTLVRVDAIVMVLLAAALLPGPAADGGQGGMEGFFSCRTYCVLLAVVVVALR